MNCPSLFSLVSSLAAALLLISPTLAHAGELPGSSSLRADRRSIARPLYSPPGNTIVVPPLKPGASNQANRTVEAIVTEITEGDTFEATLNQETIIVRLACIDAAELEQGHWGQIAIDNLAVFLPVGQPVKLRTLGTNYRNQTVAEVYRQGRSVNLQMVQFGGAVIDPESIDNCPDTRSQYVQAEALAREKAIGFWNQTHPVMPWHFRLGWGED